MNEKKKRQAAQRRAEKKAFTGWSHPVGARVEVTRDDGRKTITSTRSAPWKLGDGTPVILLSGIAGGYLLTRVRVLSSDEVSS